MTDEALEHLEEAKQHIEEAEELFEEGSTQQRVINNAYRWLKKAIEIVEEL